MPQSLFSPQSDRMCMIDVTTYDVFVSLLFYSRVVDIRVAIPMADSMTCSNTPVPWKVSKCIARPCRNGTRSNAITTTASAFPRRARPIQMCFTVSESSWFKSTSRFRPAASTSSFIVILAFVDIFFYSWSHCVCVLWFLRCSCGGKSVCLSLVGGNSKQLMVLEIKKKDVPWTTINFDETHLEKRKGREREKGLREG